MRKLHTGLAVIAAVAAFAPLAAAQTVTRTPSPRPEPVPYFRTSPLHNPFYRPEPHQALHGFRDRPTLPTGRLSRMNSAERGRFGGMLEPSMDAVRAQLLNPGSARFTGLRLGVHNDTAVLCGTVSAVGADGVRASERFIARPAAATFETEIGAQAIAAAEQAIGCRG
jgi:hypothetical protein